MSGRFIRPDWITRLPPRTVRLRLTLLYGALFLASGAVLLTITYLLVRHATGVSVFVRGGKQPEAITVRAAGHALSQFPGHLPPQAQQARAQAVRDHSEELHQLLVQSGIALGIMAVISVVLGWLVAGRVLRPLRTMTATARRISERNLHERLAIEGPHDELRDLADTVDGLLARLEAAFGAQKHFVANAAHELRTPLTLLRALIEEALSDPNATLESFRRMSRRLLAIGEQQERLLEALLTLASSERGLDRREQFDLAEIADEVLLPARPEAAQLGLEIEARTSPAPTRGAPALAERLIANLFDNAVRYNAPGGRVEVETGTAGGRAFVSATNTGPAIPTADIERLFEPFQRLSSGRPGKDDGLGLGLSIVRAIAIAHDATINVDPGPEGGLKIRVSFPLGDCPPASGAGHQDLLTGTQARA